MQNQVYMHEMGIGYFGIGEPGNTINYRRQPRNTNPTRTPTESQLVELAGELPVSIHKDGSTNLNPEI